MTDGATPLLIRPATPDDAPELAQIHWDSWIATYGGVLPPAAFDAFPLAAREALWHSTALVMQHAPAKQQQLLVAQAGALLLGFACLGPLRANGVLLPAPERGEVWALYLRPDALRRGTGSRLWSASQAWLRQAGFSEVYVWVLSANTGAVAFYRSQGCEQVDARVFDANGVPVDELCLRRRLDSG